ncbi:hypothetical protein [Streptococcus cuniculi]|uniref:Uncharacterized protein n=1 Tax=Streptococcus cuniculi TaxID=1432788 RepID=A0A4Y9J6I6_9STRE|nr:hypothetical protein [Streptococcus cuniculi]MBF0779367.1 hypothetical protein [Streptococcus cuniculi]TFU96623.1 hypothetical protein E4T82_11795 [Streptococcus cuniculi]
MDDKEKLYLKLYIFSLERIREFVLSHYDEALARKITQNLASRDNQHMARYCFQALRLDFSITENMKSRVASCFEAFLRDSEQVTSTEQLFEFAKNTIPTYLCTFRMYLNGSKR